MLSEKLYRAFKIVTHKEGSIGFLFGKGASLASSELLLGMRNYSKDLKTIIDVGANQGQFAVASSRLYPEANIYSFEPVPQVVEEFKKNISGKPKISIFESALGTTSGNISFNYNDYSHASSVLEISKVQTDLIPGTAGTRSIEVSINRLDSFTDKIELRKQVLLKLDVQGFEMEVLKGATGILNDIEYILLETSFLPMYEGEALFDEMNIYLNSIGFGLVAPLGFFQADNMQYLQMDVLYQKKK